ncbi:TetR/AcrR family transcriptional regulator [Nonomuraea maritima]|uniref:TetR/AcrR family transcriptional regulator n=1 Tax=Nonomuraea maritima TaxID=683260 RepID=UPI0015A19F1A|nr:TetR/AcrR family transcriptional regulator [Nonomuraea maritima]
MHRTCRSLCWPCGVEVARAAGVGSAALHRHFPSRWSLLQAVLTDRVHALCDRAEELRAVPDPSSR